MARLILESQGERREIKVTGPVTIGRSPTATIHIDDKLLSREHTQVYVDRGRLYVRDLESKNGTYLNGALLRQPEPLKHGDHIKLGLASVTVVLEPADAAAPHPAPPASRPVSHPPPAPPAHAVRPRPHSREETAVDQAADAFLGFATLVFLGVVVFIGAWLSKGVFVWLLGRIPS